MVGRSDVAERKEEAIIITVGQRWNERGRVGLNLIHFFNNVALVSCVSPLVPSLSPERRAPPEVEEEDRRMQFPRAPKYIDVFHCSMLRRWLTRFPNSFFRKSVARPFSFVTVT